MFSDHADLLQYAGLQAAPQGSEGATDAFLREPWHEQEPEAAEKATTAAAGAGALEA